MVTLLPHPLSPTIATVSPASTRNETPLTAFTTPSEVSKRVRRLVTSSSAVGLGSWPPAIASVSAAAVNFLR